MVVRAVALAAALCAFAASAADAQINSPALIDKDLSAVAGASLITTAGAALARAEDAAVPPRLFAEQGAPRRAANVTFRLMKLVWFDLPQEHLLLVANHEVFGHGARLRERFSGPIGYQFDPPPPYGAGGAATSFVFDREPSAQELLAVHAGGMEGSGVAASLIAHQTLAGQTMRPRDALRYLYFELDTFAYVLSTGEDEEPGQDVADFLDTYNRAAPFGSRPLTIRTLRREALVALANPMLAYAVVGLGRYVATGAMDVAVPALSIGGVRYLPMMRYRLTPFGTEWALVNELAGRLHPTTIELRVGRGPETRPWGLGVRQAQIVSWSGWSLGAAVDIWRQPRLAVAASERLTTDTRAGVLARGRLEREFGRVWFNAGRPSLILDVGVKTDGYVPGEPLRSGVVFRGGVGIPLGTSDNQRLKTKD